MEDKNKFIDDIEFNMTCSACPEQYDVYKDTELVGYVRLRHGYLYAECPYDGDIVYEAEPKGDGCFDDNVEREYHLKKIAIEIQRYMKARGE